MCFCPINVISRTTPRPRPFFYFWSEVKGSLAVANTCFIITTNVKGTCILGKLSVKKQIHILKTLPKVEFYNRPNMIFKAYN
ncbi:hypothetical protein CISIN_1g034842mg [Citrus sinensis]|uniref:Uncharacterized protein n=1 Tax=Citrus sinensis TaxID=2711 RepID=A0A067GNY6_CITSI|nr:hypothetical protein CISIN_1g034842mg [Citrus sinensis]